MEVCKKFLDCREEIKWFVVEYFGDLKWDALLNLALNEKEAKLFTELNNIWFILPDSKFNIIENPPGWNSFLNIIEI